VIRQLASRTELDGVRSGALDIALVDGAQQLRELDHAPLLTQPYVLAAPKSSPLARGKLAPANLDGQPWICVATSDAEQEQAMASCAAAGFTPDVVAQARDAATALKLVAARVGVAWLPSRAAQAVPPGVVIRRLPWRRDALAIQLVHRPGAQSPIVEDA